MTLGQSRDVTMEDALRQRLRALPSALVALSGGVDSSVVAALCAQELGGRALAVTGVSPSLDAAELAAIRAFCQERGLGHHEVDTHELDSPNYVANAPSRCYFCKTELYGVLGRVAKERGHTHLLDGTTADDLRGHRPGKRAADEHAVISPLLEAGATKADVRAIARRLGLRNAERPSSPCLSSRIAYGVTVTPERLSQIARAEAHMKALGFHEVRVRLHDTIARIEVPKVALPRALEQADEITAALRRIGFVYVTIDLAGLRSGSLLEGVRGSGT